MADQKGLVPISFNKGLDAKTDDKQSLPGSLSVLENGQFDKGGIINKRNGLTSISRTVFGSGQAISSGIGLATYGNQLLSFDKSKAYSYNSQNPSRVDKGRAAFLNTELLQIYSATNTQPLLDKNYITLNNVEVIAFLGGFIVLDKNTTSLIQTISTGSFYHNLYIIQNKIFVMYSTGSVGDLKVYTIDTSSLITISNITSTTIKAATMIFGQSSLINTFDCIVYGDIAYFGFINLNATQFTIMSHDVNLTIGNGTNSLPAPLTEYIKSDNTSAFPITSFVLFTDGTNLTIAFDQMYVISASPVDKNYRISYQTFLLSNFSIVSPLIDGGGAELFNYSFSNRKILNIAGVYSPNQLFTIMFTIDVAGIIESNVKFNTQTAICGFTTAPFNVTPPTLSNRFVINQNCFLSSKLFIYNNDIFCLVSNISELQPCYFLLGWSGFTFGSDFQRPVVYSRNLYGNAGDLPSPHLQNVQLTDLTNFNFAVSKRTLLNTVSGVSQIAKSLFKLTLNFNKRVKYVSTSKNLLFAGGKPLMYDGNKFSEAGFNSYPESIKIIPNSLLVDTMNRAWTSAFPTGVVSLAAGVDGARNQFNIVGGDTFYSNIFDKSIVPESLGGIQDPLGASSEKIYAPFYTKLYIHHKSDVPFTLYFSRNFNPATPGVIDSLYNDGVYSSGGLLIIPGKYEYNLVYNGFDKNFPDGVKYLVIHFGGISAGASPVVLIDHIMVSNGNNIPANNTNTGLDNGIYSYKTIWEWVDNAGVIYQSAASVAQRVCPTTWKWPLDADKIVSPAYKSSVFLNIPFYNFNEKPVDVKIKIYRTVSNSTADVYYLVNPSNQSLSPNIQDGGASGHYLDVLNDVDLQKNEILYSSGGIEENDVLPCLKDICFFKNRIIGIDAENDTIVYSKILSQHSQISFPSAFSVEIPGHGLKCVAAMDDKVIIFKSSQIYLLIGDGANDTGAGGFNQPQLISEIIGCSNSKSIVNTPDGIMFMSNKGYYLLDRGLGLSYIGASVENFNLNNISSAVCKFEKNQVIFTSTDSKALVYDLYFKQWSTYTNYESIDALNWINKHTIALPTGEIKQETPAVFTDDGIGYKLKLVTGWLSLVAIQGFQSVFSSLILGTWKSAHSLIIKCAYNFNETFDETNKKLWLPSANIENGSLAYQADIRFAKHKCESIKISIEDKVTKSESNIFDQTATLSEPKNLHSATVLQNGTVLICGGRDAASNALTSAQIYDPQIKTYTTVGNLNEARSFHTATLMNDGKVLIAGGFGISGVLRTTEIFDPTTNLFSSFGFLYTARSGHTATLLNSGKVLFAGGDPFTAGYGSEVYNVVSNSTLYTGDMFYQRLSFHTAVLLKNGKVLIVGGTGNNNFATNVCEIFNPATNTFSLVTSMNETRTQQCLAILDSGNVLVSGGFNTLSNRLSSCEIYYTDNNTWVPVNSMSIERTLHSQIKLLNGRVLVVGGSSNSGVLGTSEVFDEKTGLWTISGTFSSSRYLTTLSLLNDGSVLMAGGHDAATSVWATCYIYGYSVVGSGESYNISNLALEVGIKRGGFRTSIRG